MKDKSITLEDKSLPSELSTDWTLDTRLLEDVSAWDDDEREVVLSLLLFEKDAFDALSVYSDSEEAPDDDSNESLSSLEAVDLLD